MNWTLNRNLYSPNRCINYYLSQCVYFLVVNLFEIFDETLDETLHLEALYMRPDMKLMPAPVFISGAGLSYCCVYMMSGRHETFISKIENFMSPFHAGIKNHAGMKMG